jgi:hypothetical protein
MRNAYNILVTNLKRKYHFRNLSVGGRIILKKVLKKQGLRM